MDDFQELQILIIEDDQPSIAVLRNLLRQNGIESIMTLDGYNLTSQLPNIPIPDLIFLDLEMPRITGYQVLDTIRGDTRFDHTKVIAYTTHTSHLNEAKAAGFSGFMGKPLDPYRFPDLLQRVLNGEPVWEVP